MKVKEIKEMMLRGVAETTPYSYRQILRAYYNINALLKEVENG